MGLLSASGKASLRRFMTGHAEPATHRNVADATDPHWRVERGGRLMAGSTTNHTERMLQLEREYANRFPERTKADALRTRKGARLQAGQPTDR